MVVGGVEKGEGGRGRGSFFFTKSKVKAYFCLFLCCFSVFHTFSRF